MSMSTMRNTTPKMRGTKGQGCRLLVSLIKNHLERLNRVMVNTLRRVQYRLSLMRILSSRLPQNLGAMLQRASRDTKMMKKNLKKYRKLRKQKKSRRLRYKVSSIFQPLLRILSIKCLNLRMCNSQWLRGFMTMLAQFSPLPATTRIKNTTLDLCNKQEPNQITSLKIKLRSCK